MSNNDTSIISLAAHPACHDPEILTMLEELIARARDGNVMGLAIVEHQRGDAVAIQVSAGGNYHYVNSGAARLAHMLAGMDGE